MRISFPVFLVASGAAVFFSGFTYDVSFAGLAFQDPTSEMQERWLFHKTIAERIMLTGVALLSVGCIWKVLQ